MRRALVVVAAAALAVAGNGALGAAATPATPILAYDEDAGQLLHVDPLTLATLRRGVRVDAPGARSPSPDGTAVALASAESPRLELVDVRRLRPLARRLDLSAVGYWVETLVWAAPNRILALVHGERGARIAVVDAGAGRVVGTRPVPGTVVATARTRSALVLLLGPKGSIGRSTLLVADAVGHLRTTGLAGVRSGWEQTGDRARPSSRIERPGLAVDPAGRRAVVVPPSGRVAEVDLRTLAVRYHELARQRSPSAARKSSRGHERYAEWVGAHAVAVVALEQVGIVNRRQVARAQGVRLIDTRDWSVRPLSGRAGSIAVGAGTALVYGGPFAAGGSFTASSGPPVTGLTAFGADGRERFRLFGERHVRNVRVIGPYAYVTQDGRNFAIVELATGRVTAATGPHILTLLQA